MRLFHISDVTTPVTVSRFAFWYALTLPWVSGPYCPSTVSPPSADWSALTAAPEEPTLSVTPR